jgi:hypothetical protein
MLGLQELRHVPDASRGSVLVVSTSLDRGELERIIGELNERFTVTVEVEGKPTPLQSGPSFSYATLDELSQVRGQKIVLDVNHAYIKRSVPTMEDDNGVSVLTPLGLPTSSILDYRPTARWCVDVFLLGHSLPQRVAIPSEHLAHDAGQLPDTVLRTSQRCVAHMSANMGFATQVNPHADPLLRYPSASALFADLALASGANVSLSDAGRRAANVVSLWGSFDRAIADLDGLTRSVLDTFIPLKANSNGDYGVGYAIRGAGYVAHEDVMQNFPDLGSSGARDLIDRLVSINVLRRGLLLNCQRCRFEAFYRTEQVGAAFNCQACGYDSPLSRGRWYAEDPEPHWYYSLDQVVRDLIRSHGDVPLLAANRLRVGAESFLWQPESILSHNEDLLELDICLIVDGKVIVGEAKSNNSLGADKGTNEAARRIALGARLLTADEIILATSAAAWSRGTTAAVTDAIEKTWPPGPRPVVRELLRVRADGPSPSKPRR